MGRSESARSRARRSIAAFLGTTFGVIALVLGSFLAYDPLMIFHSPWGRAASYHENMRLQAAGIINNVEFDSIIIGTSMMENTSADEASRLLGGRFVNLSITASDFFERELVLRHALRRKAIDQVIFSLDGNVFGRTGHARLVPASFAFLYDRNPFNDFRAYATPNFIGCLSDWSTEEHCVGRAVSLDRPNAWFRIPEQAQRFGGLDNWFRARNDWQVKAALASIAADARRVAQGDRDDSSIQARRVAVDEALKYLDRYVVQLAKQHPNTRFYLVFPPYARIRFAQAWQLGSIAADQHEAAVRHLAWHADQLPNLEVLAFENEGFLDDIANYKDTQHYREGIDEMILQAIAAGTHRLSSRNVESYLDLARQRAMDFDLVGLGVRIEAYLAAESAGMLDGGDTLHPYAAASASLVADLD